MSMSKSSLLVITDDAGLGDLCDADLLVHVSDVCAACLITNEYDFINCLPDAAPGQCLIEDYSTVMATVDVCGPEDGSDTHWSCVATAYAGVSDSCYSCVTKSGGDPTGCFDVHADGACVHDTDRDGVVGVDDLLGLLAAYGRQC